MAISTDRLVHPFDDPPDLAPDELRRALGGKGQHLVVMASELGLPVPPGFTIRSEASLQARDGGWPGGLDAEVRDAMERLGARVGRRFGDPRDPLLVSVRSGAAVSMPGMMDTILNVGLTPDSVGGLAASTGDERFAADCMRRLEEGYCGVLGTSGVPDDPWVQLREAIGAVFRSWDSDRARAYRQREGIPEDLGTAVTVQAMVFGNRGPRSATGVLFTRDPATGERRPYGDVLFEAQGEDVVAGGQATASLDELERRLPEVAAELRDVADRLERHLGDLCDIEFTIEEGRLWLLQVRAGKRSPRAALRIAVELAEAPDFPCSREEAVRRVLPLLADPPRVFVPAGEPSPPLATGLPASPGLASGTLVTTSAAAESAAAEGRGVILVRPETSPEDIRGMAAAKGVLTASGGLASHAAVVARGWGIPAVVGAGDVRIDGDTVTIAGRAIAADETVSIDGSTGGIHLGAISGAWEVVPEAETLLGWAHEAGIEVPSAASAPTGEGPATAPSVAPGVGSDREVTPDDVVRALLVKGSPTVEALAEAMLVPADALDAALASLAADGLAERAGDEVRLSAEGRLHALDRFAAERDALGAEEVSGLLDAFHELDARMKAAVTAWQLRDVGGEPVLNDHSDADHDAGVIASLRTLHADTCRFLGPLEAPMPRFAVYRERLERSLAQVDAGDHRFIASPRVDSYHSVWFELHEDLIRLSGRKRTA